MIALKVPCKKMIKRFLEFRYPDGIAADYRSPEFVFFRTLVGRPPVQNEVRDGKYDECVYIHVPSYWFDRKLTYISNLSVRRFHEKFYEQYCEDLCTYVDLHRQAAKRKIKDLCLEYMDKLGLADGEYELDAILKMYQRKRGTFMFKNFEILEQQDNERIHVSF